MSIHHRDTCRLCDSPRVELVVKLEPIPLSENYCEDSESGKNTPRYPVDLYMCADCGHVQQLDVIDAQSLWEKYTYFSGEAKGMPEHFADVAAKTIKRFPFPRGSLIIDIGSNDGSLLRPFQVEGYTVLGIDPAVEIAAQATAAGITTIPELISLPLAEKVRAGYGMANIVCMFNAFAHADNMHEVMQSIRLLLEENGVFIFESQYLMDIVDKNLIATIFHEHISHHSVGALVKFFDYHGMELIDVERVAIQHGSIIGTVQHKGGCHSLSPAVGNLLQMEAERGLDQPATLLDFAAAIRGIKERVSALAATWKARNLTVAGFGAARSGPMLIAQLGLKDAIHFIVDDHPQKIHKYSSGDGIPIVPVSELYQRMPEYTVILAWVHSAKIIETHHKYLENGGRFVVLCPEPCIVSKDGISAL